MKCKSCPIGEHYIVVPDEVLEDEEEEGLPEVVQCPFGENAFHLGSKRCCKFPERKEATGGSIYVEETCEID